MAEWMSATLRVGSTEILAEIETPTAAFTGSRPYIYEAGNGAGAS